MKKKKLLFVEDDMITGSIYKYHFASAGYQTHLSEDGDKGLKAIAHFQPDIVVLDLMLPRLNGVEVIKHIRSQPATKSLPIIVFTNAFDKNMVAEARQAGAGKCLIKANTTYQQLLAAIADTLTTSAPPLPSATPAAESGRSSADAKMAARPDFPAEFAKSTPKALAQLRGLSQKLLVAEREVDQPPLVLEISRAIHALTTKAAMADMQPFAQMASAIELLLKELDENSKRINASSLRTVNQAIDFLGELFEHPAFGPEKNVSEFKILTVDDDALSLRAVANALERAHLKPSSFDDPFAAYEALKKDSFDLVITDINMPGMDGFELCKRLRALPGYLETPVLFVTLLNSFDSRIQSARSGGTDFIAKPFLFIELAVKALISILRGQRRVNSPAFQSFRPKSA